MFELFNARNPLKISEKHDYGSLEERFKDRLIKKKKNRKFCKEIMISKKGSKIGCYDKFAH